MRPHAEPEDSSPTNMRTDGETLDGRWGRTEDGWRTARGLHKELTNNVKYIIQYTIYYICTIYYKNNTERRGNALTRQQGDLTVSLNNSCKHQHVELQ